MRKNITGLSKQAGASLFVALMLIIGITLVLVMTARAVLRETQITADNYRTSQAVAAANYAMDFGVNYFDSGGFDQGDDDVADNIHLFDRNGDGVNDELQLTSADGSQTTYATVSFNNAAAECGGGSSWQSGLITATGFSDDHTLINDPAAARTITQCVGPLGLVKDDGPDQPLVAQGQIFLTGTANIVNRYTDTTIWAGGIVKIGSSSSIATYIKDPESSDLTLSELTSSTIADDTLLVSNKNLGNGLDIIDDDPSLGNLEGFEFFQNFFDVDSRTQLKGTAADLGQVYTDIGDADGKSGPIWIEGDAHLTGGLIGAMNSPAIIVVNGNLTSTGNSTIFGMLYIIGTYAVGGTIDVVGSNVVEGTVAPVAMSTEEDHDAELVASAPIVSGNGTLNLIFWPAFGEDEGNPTVGLTAVIAGSWRDW